MLKTPTDGGPEDQPKFWNQKLDEKVKKKKKNKEY